MVIDWHGAAGIGHKGHWLKINESHGHLSDTETQPVLRKINTMDASICLQKLKVY